MRGKPAPRAVLESALERYPDIIAIIITGFGTVKDAVNAIKQGAADFITKPFQFDALLHVETELPVRLADSPLTCVVLGAGQALDGRGEELVVERRVRGGARGRAQQLPVGVPGQLRPERRVRAPARHRPARLRPRAPRQR